MKTGDVFAYLDRLQYIEAISDDSWVPDPIGYFVIRTPKIGGLRAEHYNAADEVTTVITGPDVEAVRKCILREFPTIDIGHYGYVCAELATAHVARKDYVQS